MRTGPRDARHLGDFARWAERQGERLDAYALSVGDLSQEAAEMEPRLQ